MPDRTPDPESPEPGPPAAGPSDAVLPDAVLPDAVRRRLAAVFGDALPDTTGDERDTAPDGNDERLLADRPPHHDRPY